MVATIDTVPHEVRPRSIDALAEVERRFSEQLSPLRLFPGAALAVYRQGRLVLDLAGGYADTQRGELVGPDTLFPIFSGTKPLRRRRALAADRAGTSGSRRTRGCALAGVRPAGQGPGPGPAYPLPPRRLPDHPAGLAAGALGRLGRGHRGGRRHAAGARTRPGQRLPHADPALEIARAGAPARWPELPGLPARRRSPGRSGWPIPTLASRLDLEHRVAKLHATDGTDDWGRTSLRAMHDLPLHRMVIPAASGVSTARDMARFYAAIAAGGALDGVRILRPETVERMLAIEVDGEIDRTFDVPVRRGLGFELGGLADPRRHWPGATCTARTFWHGGFGSSLCWGDADLATDDGLPEQWGTPRRSRRHRPPRSLRRGPGRAVIMSARLGIVFGIDGERGRFRGG